MSKFPIPLSEGYQSTRVDADKQRLVNMYPHSKRGYRQFPGLDAIQDLTVTGYDSKSLSVADATVVDISWNDDGTKCFTCDQFGTDSIREYACSTAWDISTASFTDEYEPSEPDSMCSVWWGRSGTRLYVLGLESSVYKVWQYRATTAYDVSALSYQSKELNIDAQMTASGNPHIMGGPNGFNFLVCDDLGQTIYQYDMTSQWDLDTASYSGSSASFSADTTTGIGGVAFGALGNYMILVDRGGNRVIQYALTNTYRISGGVSDLLATFDLSSECSSPRGVFWGNSATRMYVADDTAAGDVFQYTTASGNIYDSSGAASDDRGAIVMQGVPYIVFGGSLFSLTGGGGLVLRGSIDNSDTRCLMDTDGYSIVICAGEKKYEFTVADGVVEITDSDLGDAFSTAHLDSRFYFDQPDGQFVAAALNDPTSIDAADFASAESLLDDVIRVVAVEQLLYVFGADSIEIWYTSGVGRPPVDRQEVHDNIGLVGRYALDVIDSTIYWIDEDRTFRRMRGIEYQEIPCPALSSEWEAYTSITDCIVQAYTWEQENFVDIHFPSENVTWCYHETSGTFSKRENASNNQFDITSYFRAYGKLYGVSRSAAKVYQLLSTEYQEDSSNITRTIDTGLITSELFQAPEARMICNGLHLTIQSSGSATVDVSLSKDQGAFGTARTITLSSGTNKYRLNRWGYFREGIFRITTTSDAKVDIVDAAVELELMRD